MKKYNIGDRFGMLTIIEELPKKGKNRAVLCMCDCGFTCTVFTNNLGRGHTTSCGCKRGLQGQAKSEFAGLEHTQSNGRVRRGCETERLYGVWQAMKRRCYKEYDPRYKSYGAKGIEVCEEWHDYRKFREWAYANGYDENSEWHSPNTCSIDRIDPNGNYCPENCRWISLSENVLHMHDKTMRPEGQE